MQWQLVLFCPCGTVPVIPYRTVNVLRHLVNENLSLSMSVTYEALSLSVIENNLISLVRSELVKVVYICLAFVPGLKIYFR